MRLPRGPRGIASRPSLEANGAVAGVSGGPYCKLGGQKMCVKKAERVCWLFYFEREDVRKIKKRIYKNYVDVFCFSVVHTKSPVANSCYLFRNRIVPYVCLGCHWCQFRGWSHFPLSIL